MSAVLLLGKVRIKVPVSGDAATVFALIGGLMLVAVVVFFAYAKIKEEGRAGWMWLGGWVGFIFAGFASALFVGRIGAPGETYFPIAAAVAVFGVGASLMMRAAKHPKTAAWFAGLHALTMLAKLALRRPLNIMMINDEPQIYPAGFGDPKVLVILALALGFAALTAWLVRDAPKS
jgi:hypothetical protein